ncbi:hypothetical protein GCM10011506_16090 [Marivirga lumbricoides]|uniref:Phage protein n=1 Tax=Marivirga lumbricoides TaxID=1046115 RepID=A0ABQ1M0K8_9BACT|nr:hypothetical protein GCM10011506_16090 [Marivirga lumbricoides]
MTDDEFDLLDELYFVQSYREIQDAINWNDHRLIATLTSIYKEGYIKILKAHDEEYKNQNDNYDTIPWKELYFLATKKGLLQHNGF